MVFFFARPTIISIGTNNERRVEYANNKDNVNTSRYFHLFFQTNNLNSLNVLSKNPEKYFSRKNYQIMKIGLNATKMRNSLTNPNENFQWFPK